MPSSTKLSRAYVMGTRVYYFLHIVSKLSSERAGRLINRDPRSIYYEIQKRNKIDQ